MPVNTFVLLRTEGVTAVIDLTDGNDFPRSAYWGADLGELSESEVAAIARSSEFPTAANIIDDPVKLAVLPEHWTGWLGPPGLSGSRSGRDWSPKFSTTALRVGGDDRSSVAPGLIATDGPTEIEVDAVDEVAGLTVTVSLGLTAGGLLRARGGRHQHRCRRLRAARSDSRLPGAAGGPRGAGHVRSLGQGADRPAQSVARGHPSPREPQRPYGRHQVLPQACVRAGAWFGEERSGQDPVGEAMSCRERRPAPHISGACRTPRWRGRPPLPRWSRPPLR